jgi:5-deoxy-glucuronate isomerase
MDIFFKSQGYREGYTHIVGPTESPLKFVTLGRLQLPIERALYTAQTEGNEVVLDILSGSADVTARLNGKTYQFSDLGKRKSSFEGRPTLVCLPPKCEYTVKARSSMLDVAICAGPAPSGGVPAVIGPDDSETRIVGQGRFERQVHMGTVKTGKVQRLMVGETMGRPGGWSSYPPHKHDEVRPGEVPQEEVYYYQVSPKQGFGIQVLYDAPDRRDGRDAAFIVRDGDTVVLDHGYHPVVSAPGYLVHYVWVLYAESDVYGAWTDDPRHAWVKELKE